MELKKTLSCPICGEEKVFLGIHLRRIHKILPKDAMKMFNMDSLTAPAYRKARSGEGNSFFGKHHSFESKDKMILARDGVHMGHIKYPCCKICGKTLTSRASSYCGEHRGIPNRGDNNPAKRPEVRAKIRKALAAIKVSRSISISKGKTGKPRPDMLGENNIAKRPEVRRKLSLNNVMKRKEIVAKQIRSGLAAPNFPERYLFNMVDSLFPKEYALNPRGEIIRIGNKMPDIVNVNGQKKVIEHYGRRWHVPEDEPKRIQHFKKFGFDCLIIWNEEFKDLDTLKKKLIEFHIRKTFNDCNQNISNEIVGQSDLHGDMKRSAEMIDPLLIAKGGQ